MADADHVAATAAHVVAAIVAAVAAAADVGLAEYQLHYPNLFDNSN